VTDTSFRVPNDPSSILGIGEDIPEFYILLLQDILIEIRIPICFMAEMDNVWLFSIKNEFFNPSHQSSGGVITYQAHQADYCTGKWHCNLLMHLQALQPTLN
jgi:hypothetical protein